MFIMSKTTTLKINWISALSLILDLHLLPHNTGSQHRQIKKPVIVTRDLWSGEEYIGNKMKKEKE